MSKPQLLAAFTNWLAFAATLAVAFLLTPFLMGRLGVEQYAVWNVAEAMLAWFTLLDMGLAACLVRGVARHRNDDLALNRLASTTLALFSAAGGVAMLVGVPLMLGASLKFGHAAFLLVMLLNVAITLPLSVFPSILDGLELFVTKSAIRVVFLTLRTLGVVFAVNDGLLALAAVLMISNILEHLTIAIVIRYHLPRLEYRYRHVHLETYYEIRRFSIDAFFAMLAGRVTVYGGVILSGFLLPAAAVVIFATTSRLVEYAKTLLRTITATLTPGVSAMDARGDNDGIRTLFLSATRLVLFLVLPIQAGLWFFGTPFLVRWVPEIGTLGTVPLMILSFTLTLSVAQSVASRILYGLGTLKIFARIALAEAILNLILMAILIPTLHLVGVALAVAIPSMLASVAVILLTLRTIQVPLGVYLRAWRQPLMMASIPVAVWSMIPVEATWPSIFGTVMLGLAPYAMIMVVIHLVTRLQRKQVQNSSPMLALRTG